MNKRHRTSHKKLTAKKAKTILKDGSVRGHKLTKAQRGFFGSIAGGKTPRRAGGKRSR